MFTKFKDFFKQKEPKLDTRQYYSNTGIREYTQEELDDNLFKSISTADYNTFTDMIKRGANINKVENLDYERTRSPLTNIIYGWRYMERDRFKFLKVLFESGVNLFDYTELGPEGTFEVDIYDSINKLVEPEYRQKTIDCLLKNYPNYMEERELKMNVNKYNL